jgi:EAL domain-containing protein (putative c-di-GMP-specific phosphodiesterase class I)
MYSETVAQWQLESDLRHGIEHQEFELYYQPIIDLKTSRVAGFEALVRWISPTRGFVSPGEFIPLAESTGLILPLGDWILREACLQMHHWHQQFNLEPKLTISINVSGYQFRSNLVRQVQQILLETQLAPQCLKLEITESAVVDNVAEAIALLRQLKTIGIELSIDDFGTGYSSLGYLQQFCADTLKVDRSFVRELESSSKNKAIVDIIVTLAHKLDMDVVAEGIETEEQKTILQALNCEYGQGYLFAKPLKSQDATDLLKQQHTVIYINNARSTKSTT